MRTTAAGRGTKRRASGQVEADGCLSHGMDLGERGEGRHVLGVGLRVGLGSGRGNRSRGDDDRGGNRSRGGVAAEELFNLLNVHLGQEGLGVAVGSV